MAASPLRSCIARLQWQSLSNSLLARNYSKPAAAATPRVLITGSLGQIGAELVNVLAKTIGRENVIATDVRKFDPKKVNMVPGPYMYADVMDFRRLENIVVEHNITWIIHLSALLSATGERNVPLALSLNNIGFQNALELAKNHNLRIFCPSTIGAFGPSTPRECTPNLTIMRPTTIYGVTKVFMELLGEYYFHKFGVDFRCLRLPGIISAESLPGGGTTDYAVDIFHQAIDNPSEPYKCYLRGDSPLPMMMLSDCIEGIVKFMYAPKEQLKSRTYNINALSFTPEEITASIAKLVPGFESRYEPDQRQAIADSWPKALEDTNARHDWGWDPKICSIDDLSSFMLGRLKEIKGGK